LLYVERGALRLEAEGRSWTLPPARAALIASNRGIEVTLPQRVTALSALFDAAVFPAPPATLSVFEVTPLARELLRGCSRFGEEDEQDEYALQLFVTLALVAWRLAEHPSPASLPSARTDEVRRALVMTEQRLAEAISFEQVAAAVACTPRTLARRFTEDLGMTWSDAQRQLRMIRAIEALAASDTSVTEVALSVGYSSLSAFNTAFRGLTGQTPTTYRRSFRAR
jgi:AraC-like DNA-binding protein